LPQPALFTAPDEPPELDAPPLLEPLELEPPPLLELDGAPLLELVEPLELDVLPLLELDEPPPLELLELDALPLLELLELDLPPLLEPLELDPPPLLEAPDDPPWFPWFVVDSASPMPQPIANATAAADSRPKALVDDMDGPPRRDPRGGERAGHFRSVGA
jgi:hypothetical protein